MRIRYRIGVMPGPWPSGPAGRDLFWRFVSLCEQSEIDSLWFSERLSSPLPVPEPMTAMAAAAAKTTRLKFGPSVLVAPFRMPVLAAREIAMVDYLSNGRMLPAFGVGAEQAREFAAAGVPFPERGRRTDEAIRIMRRCWSEDEVTFPGEFWQLEDAGMEPKPFQKPYPPLWFGGSGPAALRRAVREGDGFFGAGSSPTVKFAEQVQVVRRALEESGRPVADFPIAKRVYVAIDENAARARSRTNEALARLYGHRVESIEAAAVAGPPADCVQQLREVAAAGADLILFTPLFDQAKNAERLAAEVIPQLAQD